MVFRDRTHAGKILADMLGSYRNTDAILLAIPSGGIPVASVIARQLKLPLEVAVTSKITPSWNTEAGYGAVTFDGTVFLSEEASARFQLSRQEIREDTERALSKVERRKRLFYGDRPFPNLSGRTVILVDDGIAAGFTMIAAIEAVRKLGANRIIVAVPTGHDAALEALAQRVDAVYCPNIRSGWKFAVAEAYQDWSDVKEEEAVDLFFNASCAGTVRLS